MAYASSLHVLLLVLILCAEVSVSICAATGRCLALERRALFNFRDGLNDPENRLSSWSGQDCCSWRGVACDNITGHVVRLNLRNPHPYNPYSTVPNTNMYGFWNLSGQIDHSLLELKSLRYLDLSLNTFDNIGIPKFFGSMKQLRYLNLSQGGFSGRVPLQLGNLSSLQYLDLSGNTFLSAENLNWVSGLVSLRALVLQGVDLSMVGEDWVEAINRLPLLRQLQLSSCFLSGISPSLSLVNFTLLNFLDLSDNNMNSRFPHWIVNITSLVFLELSSNGFYGTIPSGVSKLPHLETIDFSFSGNLTGNCSDLFSGSWPRIRTIRLRDNKMFGEIPMTIGNMTLLEGFDLSKNNVQGKLPSKIGNSCSWKDSTHSLNCSLASSLPNLMYLDMSLNQLHGELPEWLGKLVSLVELDLGYNQLQGIVPTSIWELQHLEHLDLVSNRLSGSVPETLGQLSELKLLDLSFNALTGILSETHFANLRKLKILTLSSNSFEVVVTPSWLPPFQVTSLFMGSNRLGPTFPHWLRNQMQVGFLDLSNASISDSIPEWFWDISSNLSLLNLSYNQIQGHLPIPFEIGAYADVDFKSNQLQGPLPLPSAPLSLLDLSHNYFNGSFDSKMGDVLADVVILAISNNRLFGTIPLSVGNMLNLQVLDLSHNGLSGRIPPGLGNFSYLKALDLSFNYLSGVIPHSIGLLTQLKSLHVRNNSLSGEFPLALKNCSSLETLDLGENEFSGPIPNWIGTNLSSLGILRLQSNKFEGKIPHELSRLDTLHVLDLSHNNLSGQIPPSLGNLSAMAAKQRINNYLFYGFVRGVYYEESLFVAMSGRQREYNKILYLVTSIDLSSNSISGSIPAELSQLIGLLALDLSQNHLTGMIPVKIGELKQLLSLDVSENELSGELPESLVTMSMLSYMNVSNNNLSGKIPFGGQLQTFEATNYAGNLKLCGSPLPKGCSVSNGGDEEPNPKINYDEHDNEGIIDLPWTYLSVGMGFGVGFLGLYAVLLIRQSWSDAYIRFIDSIIAKLSNLSAIVPGNRRRREEAIWRRRVLRS